MTTQKKSPPEAEDPNRELTREELREALYVRKSSVGEDRQMLSIESQTEEMRKVAKNLGYKIKKEYQDSASAHKANNRPGFTSMMRDVEMGVIDGIIAWKPDRICRNMSDGGPFIDMLTFGKLKIFQTHSEKFLPKDNGLSLIFQVGMAKQYSEDLSVNVKRGNRTKIAKGEHCGPAPAGYLNDKEEKLIYPDPERFDIVRKMWDLYLSGCYSLSQICTKADEEWGFRTIKKKKMGGRPLSVSSLHKILTNPVYYGKVKKGKHENDGVHKPMVTQKEFETVQDILRREGKSKTESYDFSFTGMMKCGECGSGITAEEKVKYACPACNRPTLC